MIQNIQLVLKPGSTVETQGAQIVADLDRTAGRQKAAARGTVANILFIDADSRLEEPAMLNITLAHLASGAAAVGGLLIDGKQKAMGAGFTFGVTGTPYFRFRGWDTEHPKVQQGRFDMQALPFTFLATSRRVFSRIGLRPQFGELPYADADYCCRARPMGNIVYDPAIRVHTTGQLLPQFNDGGVQLLLASARPAYDEIFLLA